MDEHQKSYVEQMKHWFHEHEIIKQQIERTITHHEKVAQSNREQLKLHIKRVKMAKEEFDAWLKDNGFEEIPPLS